MTVNHGIDRVRATFDDESLVADAGLLLVAAVAGPAWALDAQHRAHAVVELSIHDARALCQSFFPYYNHEHRPCGIGCANGYLPLADTRLVGDYRPPEP